MPRRRLRKSPSRLKAWVLAIALHLVIVGLLVIAFRWPPPSGRDVQIIQAVAVKDKEVQQRKAEAEQRKREAAQRKREKEAARKRDEAKKKREVEKRRKEEARQRAEAERKRKQAEKKRLTEQRKRREAEEKKRAEKRRRLEEEKQRLAEERRRLEEEHQRMEEKRKREEKEERKRKEAEEQLAALMAAEERERNEAARRARALTAAEKYKALIRQKVSRNWAQPPGTETGLQCTVKVRLVPGGEVLDVKVVRSSGNEVFDRSVENAVYKASPLPLPEEKDLFEYFREIEFLFHPEG